MNKEIRSNLGKSLASWKEVCDVMKDYVSEPYVDNVSSRDTLSLVHSPLGTWIHNQYPVEGVSVSGYSETGKEIKEVSLEYPFLVKDLMELLILVEDASRIVTRSPGDPYYSTEGADYQEDQEKYRNNWENQDKILPHEVTKMAIIFHEKNSCSINGKE